MLMSTGVDICVLSPLSYLEIAALDIPMRRANSACDIPLLSLVCFSLFANDITHHP